MGFFSLSSSAKRIRSRWDLHQLLKPLVGRLRASDLNQIEHQLSRKLAGGGISKRDIILATRNMKSDTTDEISRTEAKRIRRHLLDALGKM